MVEKELNNVWLKSLPSVYVSDIIHVLTISYLLWNLHHLNLSCHPKTTWLPPLYKYFLHNVWLTNKVYAFDEMAIDTSNNYTVPPVAKFILILTSILSLSITKLSEYIIIKFILLIIYEVIYIFKIYVIKFMQAYSLTKQRLCFLFIGVKIKMKLGALYISQYCQRRKKLPLLP